MYAKDLVGKRVIRRSAVILSEKDRIMDPSYMDPNKPALIKKYNYANNSFLLVSFEGMETILSGEYDDDKWVAVTAGKKYNDVIIPQGYHSILQIYDYIDMRRENSSELDSGDEVYECIRAILSKFKSGIQYGKYDLVVCYSHDDTDEQNVRITLSKDDNGCTGYMLSRESTYIKPDVAVCDAPLFADCINKLLDNGIDQIASLNILEYALQSSFGYNSINSIMDAAVYSNANDATIIIFSTIDMYKCTLEYGMMHIEIASSEYLRSIDGGYATVILNSEESEDLYYKMDGCEYYDASYLKMGQ